MAHAVETMAYAGDVPWHGLGKPVLPDLTPEQMLKQAGLDWNVEKIPLFAKIGGEDVQVEKSALVRDKDNSILSIVSNDWNPVQNLEAFEFFSEWIHAGDMEMHTAGSLHGGKRVWALAKVKDSFTILKKDRVESFLLFTNPHEFGQSIDVRFTPIRVVCNNTLTLALNNKSENMVRVTHRYRFDAEKVKETLGLAHNKLTQYKEVAEFLSSKQMKEEDVVAYFKRIWPVLTSKDDSKKETSKSAKTALELIDTQPGAELGRGTYWQAFNAVTYMVDHILGRSVDNRLQNSWYGSGRELKIKAMEVATEMANAA